MTQRSIQAGQTPAVIIRAARDVRVQGWDQERVLASTEHKWGLTVERRSASALGHVRARAKVGDRVLFDLNADLLKRPKKDVPNDAIQVQVTGDAVVRVPAGSQVKVYAGASALVEDVVGSVAVYAGHDVRLRNVRTVVHATAGRTLDLECERLAEDTVKVSAGRDLRLFVRSLSDATFLVDDLGGYWEGTLGDGSRRIRLQAGGDVTLVTDQEVRGQPPNYVLGKIESPNEVQAR